MQVIAILVLHKENYLSINAAIGLLIVLIFSCCGELNQQETQQVNEALSDSLLSTTETWNLDMDIIEEGKKKIRLRGAYAASFNTEELNETRIQGPVSIQVYDSVTAVKTWVDSDSAIYRAESSEFEFFGDVQVQTRDNRHLESEYLNWNQAENKISTPRFIIITTPTDSIAGTGFKGANDLSTYTIRETSGRVVLD